MMELADEYGRKIFYTKSITLVCEECLASEHPELCRHKMSSMPRWLSSSKVEIVRNLLAEDPAMSESPRRLFGRIRPLTTKTYPTQSFARPSASAPTAARRHTAPTTSTPFLHARR